MNIIIVTQYFWPENFFFNDLIKKLISQGHNIKILTGKPNYPDGEIFPGYSKKECTEETFVNKNDIFRVPLRPRKNSSGFNLLMNYLSFIFNGIRCFPKAINKEYKNKKQHNPKFVFDIILVIGLSPITSAIPAIFLKDNFNIPLVIWVQDLWPESVSATGYIKNKFLLNLLNKLVQWIYRKCDLILMQSESFEPLLLQYASKNKLIYYSNSYDDQILLNPPPPNLPDELLKILKKNFCIVFTGNIGAVQDTDTWINAMHYLKDLIDLRLIIVGTGSKVQLLKNKIRQQNLSQIILTGAFASEQMIYFYQLADGLLVTLKDNPILSATVPSKIQTYLAAGRPIIGALNGEGAKIIKNANAGLICNAGNATELGTLIRELYNMTKDERQKLADAGRRYFLTHFEINSQAKKLIEIFREYLISKQKTY